MSLNALRVGMFSRSWQILSRRTVNVFNYRFGIPLAPLPPVSFPKAFLSSTTSETITAIPEPPLPPVVDEIVNALGEPTLSSLGLCSYWPSGWYQSALETLHVYLDLPWWSAIAITTFIIRLSLFPFIIDQRRSLARYSNVMPKFTILQDRFTNARLAGDYVEMMRVSKEMQEFMGNKDVNPLRGLKLLIIQVPIFLSVFAGIRGMANLPVPSMVTGGMGWFTNLTVPDPYYILPMLSMGSILLMMEALLWYWTVSNFISVIQALILRLPYVRKRLDLPDMISPPPSLEKKRGLVQGFRETMTNSRLLAELETRERMDAKSWQASGRKAVPRTYPFDPIKMRQQVIRARGTIVNPTEQGSSQNMLDEESKRSAAGKV
ncbi:unnamed protein product [Calicophoron daubneyi]|uniref:Membrane insertase YidC/Oxa/ALB C-terminal domain-containing protein n=1 Tax=Calicophoron daubneyi TaxID=300641 RepID=A0AAV2T0R4_CALDB